MKYTDLFLIPTVALNEIKTPFTHIKKISLNNNHSHNKDNQM